MAAPSHSSSCARTHTHTHTALQLCRAAGNRQMPPGGAAASWWLCNVVSSAAIVLVNKQLLQSSGFAFATTLSAAHLLASALVAWAVQALGSGGPRTALPLKDVSCYVLAANASIASLNLSLLANSVGVYMAAKLLIAPCFALLEWWCHGKRLSPAEAASALTVLAGAAIVTDDAHASVPGLAVAAASVLASGVQQLLCAELQRRHKVSAHQLLAATAHVQGALLLAVGPHIDAAVTRRWVGDFTWTAPALRQLGCSCGLAALVNLSQFSCLGALSAVTFQVLGQAKTVLVLLASALWLGEPMGARKLGGLALSVAGMGAYGLLGLRAHSQPRTGGGGDDSEPQPPKPGARGTATVHVLAAAELEHLDALAPVMEAAQGGWLRRLRRRHTGQPG